MYDLIENAALLLGTGLIMSGVCMRFGLPWSLIAGGSLVIALIVTGRIVR